MPHLDDIWYVGRARAEGAHGDLDGGQRSSEVKWGKLSLETSLICILLSASRDVHFDKRMICFLSGLL